METNQYSLRIPPPRLHNKEAVNQKALLLYMGAYTTQNHRDVWIFWHNS